MGMILRYFFRGSIFLTTFYAALYTTFVLLSFVQFFSRPDTISFSCEQFCVLPRAKALIFGNPQGSIEITYFGKKQTPYGEILQARVTNNSPQPAYYWDYSGNDNPVNRTMIAGEISESPLLCGTGIGQYHLHPGESMLADIPVHKIREKLKDGMDKEMRYGFSYSKKIDGPSEIYWSDPMSNDLKTLVLSSILK